MNRSSGALAILAMSASAGAWRRSINHGGRVMAFLIPRRQWPPSPET